MINQITMITVDENPISRTRIFFLSSGAIELIREFKTVEGIWEQWDSRFISKAEIEACIKYREG